jgi:hypothetical protein
MSPGLGRAIFLKISTIGNNAAVREYVDIPESLKLNYSDVKPCGSTLVSKDGWSWITEACSRAGVRRYPTTTEVGLQ